MINEKLTVLLLLVSVDVRDALDLDDPDRQADRPTYVQTAGRSFGLASRLSD